MCKVFKTFSFLLALLLILSVVGCNSKNDFVLNDSDEYYSIEDNAAADDSLVDSDSADAKDGTSVVKKNNAAKNNSSKNNSSDFEQIELQTGDGFIEKQVPSRKNAYKLTNVYNKMKSGESVNVVYFGGSVTGGTGATTDKKSWRALTTAYLKSVSTGTVNEINAALGGAGSYLGTARFEHDVLAKNPDLLFIEFSINDVYSNISGEQSKADLEYMIKKLYAQNPNADIVIVLLSNDSLFGSQYPTYTAHRAVADYYKIPIVDFNCETYNRLKGSSTEFKKLLKDSVHPNDKGHQQYADVMIKALKELLVDGVTAPHNIPDKKLCGNGFMTLNCALAGGGISDSNWYLKSWFDNKEYEKDGSQFRYSNNLKSIFPKYLAPKETYNSITFKFTGNSFGILGTVKESATLNVVIDSETEKVIKGVNKAELLEYPVFENLKNTAHTVTVTVNGYPPYVAIAAFVTTKP